MRPRIVGLVILIAFGIASTGCKPKIEATLKGFKEGSTDIAIVHVKASGNAEIKCTDAGQRCTSTYTPNTGEMDLDVWISDTSKPKKVFIEVTRKGKKAEAVVDLGTLPATLSVVRG